MSDSYAAGEDAGPIDVVQLPAAPAVERQPMSVGDAARALASHRYKKQNPDTPEAKAAPEAAAPEPATESAEQADAAPQETEATGETQASDPAETPPLDLPRSWTKDQTEHWAKLDRATQEFLLEHDRKASETVRRSQNEAAEKLKGLTAKEQAVEQARQQYETALPALLQTLQSQQQGQFSDIKTMEDVTKLAQTDWPRYVMWDAAQKQIAAVQQEVAKTNDRQATEKHQKLVDFATRENDLFKEKVAPEYKSPEKMTAVMARAVAELGLSPEEENALANGQKEFSPFDHRLRLLLLDGVRYRDAQKAAKAATAKTVPPVQRPGVSQPRGAAQDADVQNLVKRLDQTGSLKDAARLIAARRAAAR